MTEKFINKLLSGSEGAVVFSCPPVFSFIVRYKENWSFILLDVIENLIPDDQIPILVAALHSIFVSWGHLWTVALLIFAMDFNKSVGIVRFSNPAVKELRYLLECLIMSFGVQHIVLVVLELFFDLVFQRI